MYPEFKTRLKHAGHNALGYFAVAAIFGTWCLNLQPSCGKGLCFLIAASVCFAGVSCFFYRLISGDIT